MHQIARLLPAMVLCAAVLAGASGCRKQPPAAPAPAPPPPPATAPTTPPPPPPPPPPAPAPAPAPLSEEEIFNRKTLEQLNAERPLDDVFFAYDSSDIDESGRSRLQKDADWMKKWTSTKVSVEGHCDSRGSREYNLALGERRAAAVKAYLVSLGIAEDRIMTVSKGKEDPFCHEETESCWLQNRRGHFIITAK
jgi:peptidoglycan-associated lipoprotein